MVHKVSPLTHATATHNPTTKKNNMGKSSHGVSGVRTENNNDSRSGFDPHAFP